VQTIRSTPTAAQQVRLVAFDQSARDGYRAHVAADPETGIVTDEKLTKAAGAENSDAAVAAEFVAGESAAGPAGSS
jgi:hypothetical protein